MKVFPDVTKAEFEGQPIPFCLGSQNHGHSRMDVGNFDRWLASDNGKSISVKQARHRKVLQTFNRDFIFMFVGSVLAPFVIGTGWDDAAMFQKITKRWFLGQGLRTGVDHRLITPRNLKPPSREMCGAVCCNYQSLISRTDFRRIDQRRWVAQTESFGDFSRADLLFKS